MMHFLKHEKYSVNYNSDFSGEVVITDPSGNHIFIPGSLVLALAYEKARADLIAKLED